MIPNTMTDYLNSTEFRAALLVAVPTLLVLLRRVTPLLDLTTWPKWLQPVPPLLLAGLPVLVGELESCASTGAAFLAALFEGLAAIGAWHGLKRLKPGGVAKASAVSLILLLTGCAGSLETSRSRGQLVPRTASEPRDEARCRQLDDRRTLWGGLGKGALGLVTAEAAVTTQIDQLDRRYRPGAKIAVISSAAAVAAFGVAVIYVSEESGNRWAEECSQ